MCWSLYKQSYVMKDSSLVWLEIISITLNELRENEHILLEVPSFTTRTSQKT